MKEPEKTLTVMFNSTGLGDGQTVPPDTKERGIDQYRETSCRELQTHIQNIRNQLEANRGHYPGGG